MGREIAQALAMRERAMKVAEENAKLGWRKLELQQARSALRLLPTIRAILMDGEMAAEERVAGARECLLHDGGRLLLLTETEALKVNKEKGV